MSIETDNIENKEVEDELRPSVDIKLSYKNQVKQLKELLNKSYNLHQHVVNIMHLNPEIINLFNIESIKYEECIKKKIITTQS